MSPTNQSVAMLPAVSLHPNSTSDLNAITNRFYNENPHLEDGRLKAHKIEFEVTLRMILSLIPEGTTARILDIGGGAGPYSFALAERGHHVTLVDLSSGLISLAKSRAESSTSSIPERMLVGNVLYLDSLLPPAEQGTYDVVLLLGPLYHIMDLNLRKESAKKAWTFVKVGGSLVCSWISRWAHYRHLAMNEPERLAKKREFYEKHAHDGNYVRVDEQGEAYHAMNHEHPSNMPTFLKEVTGVSEVKMVGTQGVLAGGLDVLVNNLENDEFEVWIQKCLEVGQDEYGWMMADHIIGVAKKSTTARSDAS